MFTHVCFQTNHTRLKKTHKRLYIKTFNGFCHSKTIFKIYKIQKHRCRLAEENVQHSNKESTEVMEYK